MSPQRSCIGCRAVRDADDLFRFVRVEGPSGEGIVTFGRTLTGRGAWLCAATLDECTALAVRKRAFERAFRGSVDAASIENAKKAAGLSVSPQPRNARG